MAFVHPQSCEGVKSELDKFAVPPTQWSIDEGQWIEHQPITPLDSGGQIEFVVPGAGAANIDLANTYLFVRAKIIHGAGTNLADDTPVAPVNNWLHSLFSQVDVYLMGRLHVDLFMQDRSLLNGVTVKIRLVRSKDTFSLMAGGANPDYKVCIVDAILFVRKAVLNPMVLKAHIQALTRERRNIRYDRSTVRYIQLGRVPCRTPTRTYSLERYRNASSCGVLIMMHSTGHSRKTHFPRRTTELTSYRSTSMDVRYRRNRFNRTSKRASTSKLREPIFRHRKTCAGRR